METVPIESVYQAASANATPARGVVLLDNPLAGVPADVAARIASNAEPGGVVIAWSGWIGEPASSADGAVESDYRAWSGEGRRRLDDVMAETLPLLAARRSSLWIRPHARHVLSDGPSCAAFMRAHAAACADGRLGVLLDLNLVLTESMRARREEHVERLLGTLGQLGGLVGVAATQADESVIRALIDAAGNSRTPGPMVLRRA